MTNPYATDFDSFDHPKPGQMPPQQGVGLVKQVRVFAVLSIIQGVLEIGYGIVSILIGFGFSSLMQNAAQHDPQFRAMPPQQQQFMSVWMILVGISGIITLFAGGLRIVAGIQNYLFKGRVLGIVAISATFFTAMSCYCLPTGIALFVYGLVVLINYEVKVAFQMREQGSSTDHIFATFFPYRAP